MKIVLGLSKLYFAGLNVPGVSSYCVSISKIPGVVLINHIELTGSDALLVCLVNAT